MTEKDLRSSIRAWKESCYEHNLNVLYAMSFDADVIECIRKMKKGPHKVLRRVPMGIRFTGKADIISFLMKMEKKV